MLTAVAETDVEEGDLRDAPNGRHFVRLEVNPAAGQSGPYPVELGVRVTGKVIGPEPTPEDAGGRAGHRNPALQRRAAPAICCSRPAAPAGSCSGVVAGGAAAGMGRRRSA